MARKRNPEHPFRQAGKWKPDMKLRVRDFGPIAEGEVDLRPLTVFTGPSNTGKSWLATLIYMMSQLPATALGGRVPLTYPVGDDSLAAWLDRAQMLQFPEDPESWLRAIRDGKEIHLKPKEMNMVYRVLKNHRDALEKKFHRYYGVSEPSDLVRHGARKKAEILATIGRVNHRIDIRKSSKVLGKVSMETDLSSASMPTTPPSFLHELIKKDLRALRDLMEAERKDIPPDRHSHHVASVMKGVMGALYGIRDTFSTCYLPADRGGIMRTHETLLAAALEGASYVGVQEGRGIMPALPGVVADFLDNVLLAIRPSRGSRGELPKKIAESLERNVLLGTVQVDVSRRDCPRFSYQPRGRSAQLPLMGVSAMVSDVSPVALFLRHLLAPGDIVILEEPEGHLDPDTQRKFIQEIAHWINAGVRVILTTHSDWVVNELSNMAARARNKTSNGQWRGLNALPKEDIGVWLFEYKDPNSPGKGSVLKEIPWKTSDGGFDTDFYDVSIHQNNEWARAVNEYAYSKRDDAEQ